MRITMVGSLPPIKGMSAYCLSQVQALSKLIKIDFINFKTIYPRIIYPIEEKEDDKVFKVKLNGNVSVDERLRWYNLPGSAFAGYQAKNKLLHFHWWTSFLFIVFFPLTVLAKWRGKKILCTAHNVIGHESSLLDRLLCRWMLAVPDHFIVHSEKNKKQLTEHFGVLPEHIDVIPHGRYDFYIDEVIEKKAARHYLQLPENAKVVLFFGHVRNYKGVDTLLEAVSQLKSEFAELTCIIAGKNWVSWDPFQKIIDENKLQDIVEADLEYVPSSKVKYLFSAADVVVLPYKKFDSQSGPGNIALAFNKALIVSEVGGLPDLVLNEKAIFEPGNVKNLTECLRNVLKNDTHRVLLENDSKELAKKYSWDEIAKQTVELYRRLLKNET